MDVHPDQLAFLTYLLLLFSFTTLIGVVGVAITRNPYHSRTSQLQFGGIAMGSMLMLLLLLVKVMVLGLTR